MKRLTLLFVLTLSVAGCGSATTVAVGGARSTDPILSLSPTIGPPTTRTNLTGAGFEAMEAIDITFDAQSLGTAMTDVLGGFAKTVSIPKSALPGEHTLVATGEAGGQTAGAPFTVRTDWSMMRFSADRGGNNRYENVLSPETVSNLQLRWTATASAEVGEESAVTGGMAYAADLGGGLLAADAETGAILWRTHLGTQPLNAPTVAGGVLYVTSFSGRVFALDGSTGKRLWSKALAGVVGGSPLVSQGRIYIGAGSFDGTFYALDARTGETLWTAGWGGGSGSAAIQNGILYVGGGVRSDVEAFDARTGTALWKTALDGYVDTTPAAAGHFVYVGTDNTPVFRLYALASDTGQLAWAAVVGGDVLGSPAVGGGRVAIGTLDDKVYCFDAQTGKWLWTFLTGGDIWSSPAIANGVVYIGSDDFSLYALDAASGRLLWSYATGGRIITGPAVSDGKVYVGAFDKKLYSFGLP